VTDAERRSALEAIAAEARVCTRCRLHETRTQAVPGEGSPSTEVVLVGEGPGEQEDRQGRPFVGASGQLLAELIGSLGWERDDVFITNVVKCRPPGNRDPQPDEIGACAPYLRRQLEVLDPAVVVTVGKHSLGTFRPGERIGRAHGTTTPADPATGARDALVFAMYHPAYALYQRSNRQTLFDDMAGLPAALIAARRRRAVSAATLSEAPTAAATPTRATPASVEPHGFGQTPTPPPGDADVALPATPGSSVAPATAVPAASRPSVLSSEPDTDQLTLF
jgi:uracil-DNA glycosylase family 4